MPDSESGDEENGVWNPRYLALGFLPIRVGDIEEISFRFDMPMAAVPVDGTWLRTAGYGRNLGELVQWLGDDQTRFSGSVYRKRGE